MYFSNVQINDKTDEISSLAFAKLYKIRHIEIGAPSIFSIGFSNTI